MINHVFIHGIPDIPIANTLPKHESGGNNGDRSNT